MTVKTDRFGNPIIGELPYARGKILSDTEQDLRKVAKAWRIINSKITQKGPSAIFNFTGLERKIVTPSEGEYDPFDDEISPALYFDKLRSAALEHLGGDPKIHDVAVFNRMAAATLAAHLALVKPGETVVGVSASCSHSTIIRAAKQAGAKFIDTVGFENFAKVMENESSVSLVALTRLAVTYETLPLDELHSIINLAKRRDVVVYMDDAGGARVGPAFFNQPKMLELGIDAGSTGLDKYGTQGPRFGLMGGEKGIVAKIRSKGFELGLEARPMLYGAIFRSIQSYNPKRVLELIESTKRVATELKKRLGSRVTETPVTAQLLAENVLQIAMEKAKLSTPPIVPYEAAAALAMILLEDYGIITVHFAGLPPGTASILIKFIPPETLNRFGGPERLAAAIDASLDRVATVIGNRAELERLLFD